MFVSSYRVMTPKRLHGSDLCTANLKSYCVLAEGVVVVSGGACVYLRAGELASPGLASSVWEASLRTT